MTYKIDDINDALKLLKEKEVVAIPTETVYGLAAMITHEEAVKKVFELKQRPLNHPLIIHVADASFIDNIVEYIPDYAQKLIDAFWPGPLTLIFKLKPGAISTLITGGQDTVAIRCPAHPKCHELLTKLATPVVAPSANPFGKVSPTTAEHVIQSFADKSFAVLEGGRCPIGIESTLVDASHSDHYQILRHGMITSQEINNITGLQPNQEPSDIRAPGKLKTHYQPQTPLYYSEKPEVLTQYLEKSSQPTYLIAWEKPKHHSLNLFAKLSKEPEKAAYQLYDYMRAADDAGVKNCIIILPPNEDVWAGIRERIIKAGQPIEESK